MPPTPEKSAGFECPSKLHGRGVPRSIVNVSTTRGKVMSVGRGLDIEDTGVTNKNSGDFRNLAFRMVSEIRDMIFQTRAFL